MSEKPKTDTNKTREEFIKRVEIKETRKINARDDSSRNVWMGFVKYGAIGWSVAVPMLIGVACGLWLDKNYPCPHSWTLSLMALGLFIGCVCAWHWVETEEAKIGKKGKDDDE